MACVLTACVSRVVEAGRGVSLGLQRPSIPRVWLECWSRHRHGHWASRRSTSPRQTMLQAPVRAWRCAGALRRARASRPCSRSRESASWRSRADEAPARGDGLAKRAFGHVQMSLNGSECGHTDMYSLLSTSKKKGICSWAWRARGVRRAWSTERETSSGEQRRNPGASSAGSQGSSAEPQRAAAFWESAMVSSGW